MSFPRAPSSFLQAVTPESSPQGPFLDPENRDKRYSSVTFSLIQAKSSDSVGDLGFTGHARTALWRGSFVPRVKANKQSIAEVKLRMMKAMVETATKKPPKEGKGKTKDRST
jgi:hypothetical protein